MLHVHFTTLALLKSGCQRAAKQTARWVWGGGGLFNSFSCTYMWYVWYGIWACTWAANGTQSRGVRSGTHPPPVQHCRVLSSLGRCWKHSFLFCISQMSLSCWCSCRTRCGWTSPSMSTTASSAKWPSFRYAYRAGSVPRCPARLAQADCCRLCLGSGL